MARERGRQRETDGDKERNEERMKKRVKVYEGWKRGEKRIRENIFDSKIIFTIKI